MIFMIPYILILHWLIYRLHRKQMAHEAIILAAVRLIGQMAQRTLEAERALEAQRVQEALKAQEAEEEVR
jgi:hypothetical protein